MPYHEVVVVEVAHLLLAILEQMLVERLFLGDRVHAQQLVHTGSNLSITTISIIRMEQTLFAGTILLDILDDVGVLALSLGPCRRGIEEVTIATCHVGDIPDSIGTSTILQRTTCHSIRETLHRTMITAMLAQVIIGS